MSEFVRLLKYVNLLNTTHAKSVDYLMSKLEISKSTLNRDLNKLRDQMGVPIVFDRDRNGYLLSQEHEMSSLPGLWFNHEEILALVTLQQLLEQLQLGILGSQLSPIQQRLNTLMMNKGLNGQDVAKRIKILYAGKRSLQPEFFQTLAAATLSRHQIEIQHYSRQNNQSQKRILSPQKLIHYRDNWYLLSWCHTRQALRSFSIDAIQSVQTLSEVAKEVEPSMLNAAIGEGYGIFGGKALQMAKLVFSAARARWVKNEVWHPKQSARFLPDGRYELTFPYADDRELIGDILRFGPDVEVIEPVELRKKLNQTLLKTAMHYT